MTYQSRYYNLDEYHENAASKDGWTKEQFAWAVEKLETMPREKLLTLCALPQIQLTFLGENWKETVPEEEIIGALISDFPPQVLTQAIRNLEKS